jgi:D-threo-aldose 1-dehydrogenase
LRTERIDIWLLHEVTADDLRSSDELLKFLEASVAAGKIGAFGVGSERARVETLAIKRPKFCGVMQFEWSVVDRPVRGLEGFRIHHRALTDNFRSLHAGLLSDKVRCARWSEQVEADLANKEMLAGLMLKASLTQNPESVVLFSSKSPAHMKRNVEFADDVALERPANRLYELVQGAAKSMRETEAGG